MTQETADLVTFTEEILNGKLHFLCSVIAQMGYGTTFILEEPLSCETTFIRGSEMCRDK